MKTIKETAKAMQSIYNDCYYKIAEDEFGAFALAYEIVTKQ